MSQIVVSLPRKTSPIPPQLHAIGNDLTKQLANLSVSGITAAQQDYTFSLPDELLLRIFSLFPVGEPSSFTSLIAIHRVSKRFKTVATDPTLWRPHLDYDFYYLNQFPNLFGPSPFNFEQKSFQQYFGLRRSVWASEQALRKVVLAASNRTALLDKVAIAAKDVGSTRYLERLTTVEPDEDPEHWLSTRYWARVAVGVVSKEEALRAWAKWFQLSTATGQCRGWECLALAHFSCYTGGNVLKVLERLNTLSLADLEIFMPTNDMSTRSLLQHIWKAFQSAGLDLRALNVESFFLHEIFAASSTPLAPQGTQFPSPSSVILFVEYLNQIPAVKNVAILSSDQYVLGVTFVDGSEILFLQFSTGEVWSREQAINLFPTFELESLPSLDDEVPYGVRTTIGTLLFWTAHFIERVLRAKYPTAEFRYLIREDLTSIERDAWILLHQVRLLKLISRSDENNDLSTIFSDNRLPTHSPFERDALSRVFAEVAELSRPAETVDRSQVVLLSPVTEEEVDDLFPHCIDGCDPQCCSFAPRDLASFHGGGKTDWFERGHSVFYDSERGEIGCVFVVVAFEYSTKDFAESDEVSYLCLKLSPGRHGCWATEIVQHLSIQIAPPVPVATLLQPELEVGQFFRTIGTDGLLVPNAWLERMLEELDASESAVEWWDSRVRELQTDQEDWLEQRYDELERDGEFEEMEYEWKDAGDKKSKGKFETNVVKGKNAKVENGSGGRTTKGSSTCMCGRGRGGRSSRGRAKAGKQVRDEKTWN